MYTNALLWVSTPEDLVLSASTEAMAGNSSLNGTAEMVPVGACPGSLYLSLVPGLRLGVMPVIYAIGIPGNLLSLAIWLQREMRGSTACYFAALSISDTLVLALHLVFTVQWVLGHSLIENTAFCRAFNVCYLSMECLSLLLVLGLTVDRLIVIKLPLSRFKYSTVRRTVKVIALLIVVSFMVGVSEGIMWSYDVTSSSCVMRPLMGGRDMSAFLKCWNLGILCTSVLLPICTILLLNCLIIHTLRKRLRRRKVMMAALADITAHALNGVCKSNRRNSRMRRDDTEQTILLLCVSFYLVLSESPDSISYLLRPFYMPGPGGKPLGLSFCDYLATSILLETFALTNYAFNVLIYSLAGRRFRACLKHRISRWLKIHQDKDSTPVHSVNSEPIPLQPYKTSFINEK